jgi:hypothetical protein
MCGGSLDGLRRDAIYCCAGCRYRAWVQRHPTKARQRLATLRAAESWKAPRRTRSGPHGEAGTRIYFTSTDLDELGDLTGTAASPRLLQKVREAMLRIGRAERP